MCAEFDRMAEACIDAAFVVMEHGTPGMRTAMLIVLAELDVADRERLLKQPQGERMQFSWGYHALLSKPAYEQTLA